MKLTWKDSEDIALALFERFPNMDPLTVRFTDLREWVLELAAFADDPERSNEAALEGIQMAWLEEYRAAHGVA
jgi:FeS assembly protein IscX